MPPKTNSGASKKVETKKKEKIIEDKTFGLKNKKGSKQQKFIVQVEKQVKSGGVHNLLGPNVKKEEKEKKLKEQKELAAIFRPVQTQKIDPGTDPKSVVCAFFKQGQCTKGDRCKFSHDLSVERKQEKRSLYHDGRAEDEEKEADTMDNWNDDKLKEVVDKKHSKEKNRPTTDIVSTLSVGMRLCRPSGLPRFLFSRRSASTSWTPWRSTSTDGSGSVLRARSASTGTPCLRATC